MAISDLVPWKRAEKKVSIKRAEQDPIYELQRGINRLFDEFFNFDLTPFGGLSGQLGVFSPQVDMTESDQEIRVSVELPGLDEKEIEVSLAHDVLTISGNKKAENEEKGENYYRMERSYGSFQRSISLPCEVEADKVEATFEKGVLTITLPKTEAAQKRKRIAIKTA